MMHKLKATPKGQAPIQLFRPEGSCDHAEDLLQRGSLQDMIDFIEGKGEAQLPEPDDEYSRKLKCFKVRRRELRELADKVDTGEARVDEDGRLVPVTEPPQPPRANLPPPPPPPGLMGNNNNNNNNNPNNMNNNNMQNGNGDGGDAAAIAREERDAARAIARAVARYRDQGVAEEDFELVLVPTRSDGPVSLTFRRICFAVLAVVTAFICVLLQTLPVFETLDSFDPTLDPLMHELLRVKDLYTHAQQCTNLNRDPTPISTIQTMAQYLGFSSAQGSCDDGVLHIPSNYMLFESFRKSQSTLKNDTKLRFAFGVNVSWFLPCRPPAFGSAAPTPQCYQQLLSAENSSQQVCPSDIEQPQRQCFRGIHDTMVTDAEVSASLRLGEQMVRSGGDHFDIHYDIDLLSQHVPSLIETLRNLLNTTYGVNTEIANLNPVAFRVNSIAPMDAQGVTLKRERTLNGTRYLQWLEKSRHTNDLASFYSPWPFNVKPARDVCKLSSDLEANPKFAIYTSVELREGTGVHYGGGASLFVDDHQSNDNHKRRIQRGVSIDGAIGRIIVSTGGLENRRCRLPTRFGVRTVLQIWWGY